MGSPSSLDEAATLVVRKPVSAWPLPANLSLTTVRVIKVYLVARCGLVKNQKILVRDIKDTVFNKSFHVANLRVSWRAYGYV